MSIERIGQAGRQREELKPRSETAAERSQTLQSVFTKADTNHDGTISKDEAKAAGLNAERYGGKLVADAVALDLGGKKNTSSSLKLNS